MCDYLSETHKKDLYRKPKDKTSHNDVVEAQKMLDKWASPPMTRNVYSRKFEMNHRTLVKPSKGLRPGEVTKLTVFPYGYSNFQTREEVNELAKSVINRRSTLDYEDFGVFKSDVTSIVFVEHVTEGDSVRFECSCVVGGKGSRKCEHVLAMEMATGQRDRVEEPVYVADSVKTSGRPKKVRKQRRT